MRPRTDTYGLVLGWIAIVGGVLALLGGILISLLILVLQTTSFANGLDLLAELVGFAGMPIIGGLVALIFGIGRVRKLPAHKLSVPSSSIFVLLTLAVLGGGAVLWNRFALPGPVDYVVPIVILSGVLPALAIVFFGARRLGQPTTTRHFWLSLFWGATGAIVLALVLEIVLSLILGIASGNVSSVTSPLQGPPLIMLATLSVIAPLVEEGVKPLGAIIIMRRLRAPGEAFLLGLAAGVGFDIVETIGYIGMNEADWITVAIQRIGAGLLHGVGAGMAALGWYYLINGKGVPNRWLKGVGGIAYAVLQHAIFNGSNLLTLIPSIGSLLGGAWYIGALPFEKANTLFFVYYAIILGVLIYVTGRLSHGAAAPPIAAAGAESPGSATAPSVVGGVR
jgi:RsiW-degrading membrane proteinase PrsW (M82 family)